MADVVGLHGGRARTPPTEPVANVVVRCRELLAQAESGNLRGLLIASVNQGGLPAFYWSYDDVDYTSHALSSALLALVHEWSCTGVSSNEKRDGAT
jgi:hypothetical protein